MWKNISAILCVVVAVCYWYKQNEDVREVVDILIAIPSARHHFARRDSLRRTWLSLKKKIPSVNVKSVFIVGDSGCSYPPEDRMDDLGCVSWGQNIDGYLREKEFVSTELIKTDNRNIVLPGYSFRVRYPVEIHKVGIASGVLHALLNSTSVNVILHNQHADEELASVQFAVTDETPENGFVWTDISPVVLLENLELLIMAKDLPEELIYVDCQTSFTNMEGVLQYTSSVSYDGHHYEKLPTETCYAVNFQYRIQDQEKLKEHVSGREERQKSYTTQMSRELGEITREIDMHDDIVFVDVFDTYRNLTMKMAKFYAWATQHVKFKFLLKTDDDVFIDLPSVLKNLPAVADEDLGWWTNFRENWAVNLLGKWADFEYRSASYPRFGCGAGNVLTYAVVEWLGHNQHLLKMYPFEDTALGIWLAAVDVEYLPDVRWSCNRRCEDGGFNVGELTVDEIYKTWETYNKCQHICNCDEFQ